MIECLICAAGIADKWIPLESANNYQGLPIETEVYHPTHHFRIGLRQELVRWDYSAKEVMWLGDGDYHQGAFKIERVFMDNFTDKSFVYDYRPFAKELRSRPRI